MKIIKVMEQSGLSEREVKAELEEAYNEDWHFSQGRILYSMCNESPPLSVDAHMQFIEANLGDPNLYPGTKALEISVIRMLLSILNGKAAMGGNIVAGGSEANITALWIYRKLTRKRRVLLPEKTAHYSFETAADMLGMELVHVPINRQFRMDTDKLRELLDMGETACVVAVAGTTEHGQIDPIEEISRICKQRAVYLHVDAAFGGMVFPFLSIAGYKLPSAFDFSVEGVTSITVDPHKMGQATTPAGALLLRNPEWYSCIEHRTAYLSQESFSSILGTRCSASVASAYAMMRNYGISGYVNLLKNCMNKVEWFVHTIKNLGLTLAIPPISPVVCIQFGDERTARDVQRKLLEKRWWVSRTANPHGIRVVMMPHVRQSGLTMFVADLHGICKELDLK
jgi:tyrosine decarboxylase/aspartate 1-decarboxylase